MGGVLWFTGLPASGKKTLAFQLERRLFNAGYEVYAFDSAWQRQGLTSDLGFSRDDRRENIRRAGELAAVMARSGLVVITAFISPYAQDRAAARQAAGDNFHEIYMDVPLEICVLRDTRDRYGRAERGEVEEFTGISAPYEAPLSPEVSLGSDLDVGSCVDRLAAYVDSRFRSPFPEKTSG